MRNLVIVDIGSNSSRMSAYQIDADGFCTEIKRCKSSSRLSEGMGIDKYLTATAIDRTIESLQVFKKAYSNIHDPKVITIATAAVRQAKNQKLFLKKVRKKVGLNVRVLSGHEEAYYDYLGVVNRVKMNDYLVMDIGGASIELVRVRGQKRRDIISIPVGAVNISERFNLSNHVYAADLFNAQRFLKSIFHRVPWLKKSSHYQIVMLGGAARTLARINRNHQSFQNVDHLNGYYLNQHRILGTYEMLLRKNLYDRKHVKGLEKDRADIILGGLLPLITLLDELDSRRVIFSDGGVREGIVNEYLNKYYRKY
ncbi:Ppx/GppA family phosphatase [Apilactobacillus apisilvae]|uniref:Ppx/GppA family phosphatase n=1 Tax=Apilactobacillus apisilvae TaxID=2923364 RepID=A0ABY4PGN1_9LACO|nr:Ppx/GppA family phosphatase [Apilactobacillus apisilvae]UQS84978.1 Ppx/GppA family phosphatase [Apilactobacillus apisilvae]